MGSKKTKQLFVPDGPSEEQVVAYVESLTPQTQNGGPDSGRQSSLVKLAEQTVIEAHKLAEEIKEQAIKDAEAQSAEVLEAAEGGAREQAHDMLEVAKEEACRLSWRPYMFYPALPQLLGRLKTNPTLIVWGRQDAVVPLSVGEAYHEAIQGSRVGVVAAASEVGTAQEDGPEESTPPGRLEHSPLYGD